MNNTYNCINLSKKYLVLNCLRGFLFLLFFYFTHQIPSLSESPIMYGDGLMCPSSNATIGGSGKNGFGDSGSDLGEKAFIGSRSVRSGRHRKCTFR